MEKCIYCGKFINPVDSEIIGSREIYSNWPPHKDSDVFFHKSCDQEFSSKLGRCQNPLGCTCKEVNGYFLLDCNYWY